MQEFLYIRWSLVYKMFHMQYHISIIFCNTVTCLFNTLMNINLTNIFYNKDVYKISSHFEDNHCISNEEGK